MVTLRGGSLSIRPVAPSFSSPHRAIAHRDAFACQAPCDTVLPEPDDNLLARHRTITGDVTVGTDRRVDAALGPALLK